MGDLISRSELIKEIDKYCGIQSYLVSENVREIIKNQPTAYDIDKVVEELETKENEAILKAPNTSDLQNPDYQKWMMKSYGFKEAIEIVKQGGTAND